MDHASATASHVADEVVEVISRRRKILKWIGIVTGGFVLLVAILLVSFRIALSRVPEYQVQLKDWVSKRTGLDIEFARLDARWRFYGPELVFRDARVRSRDGLRELVRAERVSLAFDMWSAIGSLRWVAGRITLEKPELQVIRTREGRIEVVGQGDLPERDPNEPFKPDALPTGRLYVVDAHVTLRDLKTGRGPWIVPGVSFELKRRGRSMHLEGEAKLPSRLGKLLLFKADTAGRLADTPDLQWNFDVQAKELDLDGWHEFSPNDWLAPTTGTGSFQIAGIFTGTDVSDLSVKAQFKNIALTLPTWRTPLPSPAQLEPYVEEESNGIDARSSTKSAETVARSDATKTQEAPSELIAEPESPAESVAHGKVTYSTLAFDVRLLHARSAKGDTWNVRVKDLELSRADEPWRRSAMSLMLTRTGAGGMALTFQSDLAILENIWPLLAYAPESQALATVRALNATGRLSEVQFDIARAAPDAPLAYSLHARFAKLGVQAIGKSPGMKNLSGVIDGGDAGGTVELNVRDAALDLPRFFRTPFPIDRLAGSLKWRQDETAWHIDTNDLLIDNEDGHASASGEIRIPKDGASPEVDLHAKGWDLVARSAPRYIPASKTPPKVLDWLDRAFTAGTVPQAEFEMRGPVRQFPFRNDEGLFLIKAHIAGLALDYQPGFIPATDLTIDAEFRNQGMVANLIQGNVNGLPLTEGTGEFKDFKHAELLLNAKVQGDLNAGLQYVQRSPIGPAIGSAFMGLHGGGELRATVDLRMPFKNIDKRKLTVAAELRNGTTGWSDLPQSITGLNGSLTIRDHALYALKLQGRFLDGPLTINGNVEGRYTGPGAGVIVTAQGRAFGPALAKFAHLPSSIAMGGAMNWQFVAHSPRHAPDETASPVYRVESDTKGLSVALPTPLGKSAESERPLKLEVDATRNDAMLVRASFGSTRAFARLQKDESGWSLDRGGIRADGVAPALPAHAGLRIEGAIDHFVLDDWLKLKSDEPGKHQLSDFLRAANVRVQNFGFLGFNWRSVRAILQATDDAWRVDVAGNDVEGQLSIPYQLDANKPLQLALSKLSVGEHEENDGAGKSTTDPRDIPAMVGRVDEFNLLGHTVGMARFALEKVPRGVRLSSGELRGNSFTVTARGSWLSESDGTSNSSLIVDVASTDVRETLRAFDFRDVITGKRANAHAALTWPGGVDADLLGRASGKVQVEVLDGQLLSVDPGGAGRVLGLLSIGALPRRLSLDFSDFTDKGISFDRVHGDFELSEGDAFTNNLVLRGPQAEVGIVGRTGLGKRDYDLTAVGTGDIGGSLSVAGAVVGGPVLGAAVLAFSRLFKEPLKGVTRRYYHITGPWENPTVERIDKEEAKQGSAHADAAVTESQRENAHVEDASKVTVENAAPDGK